jgi:sigma-B regulation protein RsbU (phosphoserine phosphatase)
MRTKTSLFKLLRYFSLTSLLTFVIVMALLWQLYHQIIAPELIGLGERQELVPLIQITEQIERHLLVGTVAILAFLYAVLFLIVRHADTIVRRQHIERKRAEEALRESQQQLEVSYQREQERRQLSETLREVSKIVSSSLEQQKVVDIILAQLEQVITYHRATVSFLEGDILTLAAGQDKMGGEIKPYSFIANKYPLNAEVLTNKRPVLVPDVTRDERWQPTSFMQEIRSFICAPLLVQDQPIGILAVGRLDHIPYTDEDAQTVFAFATQVAIAMRNAQLHAEAQERNRRLALLHEISLAINSTLDLPILLTAACQKLVENFYADHSEVLFFDDTYTYGEVIAEFPSRSAVGICIPLEGYAAIEKVIATAQPLVIDDAQRDPSLEKVWEVMRSLDIQSILIMPLIIKGRVIGSFSLDINTPQRQFEPSEIELVQTIATQLAMVIDNARLIEKERTRIEQEIETARQIQSSLLPPDVPDIPGLDIAGFSEPARQVGGDFYNYFVFDHNHLGIAVGDVSGKGMRAALMMTLSFGLLTTEVRRTITPADLITILNTELRPHTQHNKMNTALGYLTLIPSNGAAADQWDLYAANAGLIAPLVRRRDGTVEWLDVAGLPLGAVEETEYTQLHDTLFPGDLVLLSSDGIVEARNTSGEIYSFDRLATCVATAPCQNAKTIQECILDDVRAFVGEAETHDDLTMIVVMVKKSL